MLVVDVLNWLRIRNIWFYAYDNKGKVYIYDKRKDTFVLKCNLQNILGGSIVLNELLVDEKGNFWLAMG